MAMAVWAWIATAAFAFALFSTPLLGTASTTGEYSLNFINF